MRFTPLKQPSPPAWVLFIVHVPVALLSAGLMVVIGESFAMATHLLPLSTLWLDRINGIALPYCLLCGFLGSLLIAWLIPSMARSGRWVCLPAIALLLPECLNDHREIFIFGEGTRPHKILDFVNDDFVLIICLYLAYSLGMFWVVRRTPPELKEGDHA